MNDPVDTFCAELHTRYPDAVVRVDRFPSGSFFLDVVRDGRLFVIEYRPGQGYGFGEVKDGEGFNSGHPHAAPIWEEVTRRFTELLGAFEATRAEAAPAKSA